MEECERRILSFGGCVARLVPLYGPGRCELLRRHIAREPKLAGPPERVLNYVHVEDAADAIYNQDLTDVADLLIKMVQEADVKTGKQQ